MQCDEGCYIAYHSGCWRRFKGDSVVGSDRDFLCTQCPTPDCEGRIKCVSIHDSDKKNKVKVQSSAHYIIICFELLFYVLKKFEADLPPRKTTPTVLPTSLNIVSKESKRSNQIKQAKKKSPGESVEGVSSKVSTPGEGVTAGEEGGKEGKIKEDLRRVEDSLAVINRQAEQEEEEQVGVALSRCPAG